jgi:hypothetical protein
VKIGHDKPDLQTFAGLEAKPKDAAGKKSIRL